MVNSIVIHAEPEQNPHTRARIVTHFGTKMNKQKPPHFITRKVTLLFGTVNKEYNNNKKEVEKLKHSTISISGSVY